MLLYKTNSVKRKSPTTFPFGHCLSNNQQSIARRTVYSYYHANDSSGLCYHTGFTYSYKTCSHIEFTPNLEVSVCSSHTQSTSSHDMLPSAVCTTDSQHLGFYTHCLGFIGLVSVFRTWVFKLRSSLPPSILSL